MVRVEILKTEMKYNKQFATYVNKYAQLHGCDVDDVLSHDAVQSAYKQYSDV